MAYGILLLLPIGLASERAPERQFNRFGTRHWWIRILQADLLVTLNVETVDRPVTGIGFGRGHTCKFSPIDNESSNDFCFQSGLQVARLGLVCQSGLGVQSTSGNCGVCSFKALI